MLTEADFLHLPFTPDLNDAGAAIGLGSASSDAAATDDDWCDALQRMVAHVAVGLALRRHLTGNRIPFKVTGGLPFSEPNQFDVTLGGHRCHIVVELVTDRADAAALRRRPSLLLDEPAAAPSASTALPGNPGSDVVIFAWCLGLLARSARDLKRASAAGQPCLLVHRMPTSWRKPRTWRPIGTLALKSESAQPVRLELIGADKDGQAVSTAVQLEGGHRIELQNRFFSIASVQLRQPAPGRLALRNLERGTTHVIGTRDFSNIWIYGVDIILTGYLASTEFRLPRAASSARPDRPGPRNAARVKDLKPLAPLFEQVKGWHATRRT